MLEEGNMMVDRWLSVFTFAAVGCLATPNSEGSGSKEDNQANEPASSAHETPDHSAESELSFVAGLTCIGNADCGRRSYCQYPAGQCEGAGTCQTKPKTCTQIHAPVCGCDDRTYSNDCAAATAGASVRHEGECKAGEPCGSVVCEPGLECCNAGCGICVPPGGACTQEACE
jgi:hypothetical protein